MAVQSVTTSKPDGISLARISPLESGDRLTRREFERRYKAMPRIKKAAATRARDLPGHGV